MSSDGMEAAGHPLDASRSSSRINEPDFEQSNQPTESTIQHDKPTVEVAPKRMPPAAGPKPAASNDGAGPSTNPAATIIAVAESQPMTAMSSSSSSTTAMPTPHLNEAVGPSPYGTRSRNRNVNNRPNYAEDRELDMDYEWTSAKKASTDPVTTFSTTPPENERRSTNGGRRSLTAGINGSSTGRAGVQGSGISSKDYIPGMSTFSVNSETSTSQSKKRKAPGNQSSSSSVTPQRRSSTTSTRRTGLPNASNVVSRETNMLTFESSQGFLKDGLLVADDGTRLEVNGMLGPSFHCTADFSRLPVLLIVSRSCLSCLRTSWRALLPCSYHGVLTCRERPQSTDRVIAH